jgi:hypothetical protein
MKRFAKRQACGFLSLATYRGVNKAGVRRELLIEGGKFFSIRRRSIVAGAPIGRR